MKLQKATLCGLYAVLELAAYPERQIAAAEIAGKYDISINHLAKVLRLLVRARLIESVRGAGGGYRFCGNAKRVTLLDVIELFEDIRQDMEEAPPAEEAERRALHGVLAEIDDIAIRTLRSISIATLVKLMEKARAKVVKGEAGAAVTRAVAAAGK